MTHQKRHFNSNCRIEKTTSSSITCLGHLEKAKPFSHEVFQ